MPAFPEIHRAFAAYQPELVTDSSNPQAAVAVVLRERSATTEVLFIERSQRDDDPWSGHMAFPGGHVEASDANSNEAAERETEEEVGLSLEGAELIGRLDDQSGGPAASPLVISAFVYKVEETPPLAPNYEVREAFWFPVPALLERERRVEHPPVPVNGNRYPGILVGEPGRHVVWGVTLRFVEGFLRIAGRPLPERPWPKWTG